MSEFPKAVDFRLDNKVAVITGAASGIGEAIARLFSEKGATVCALDLNLDKARKVAESLPGAAAYQLDVADNSSIDKAVQEVLKKYGNINILVNSAGIGPVELAEDYPEKDWYSTMSINLNGTFFMSQRVGRSMIAAKKGGKIINLASQAGIVAIEKHVAYSASKAAIISITQTLGFEWGKYGIQVNAISPTATNTPLIVGYWDVGERHTQAIANTPAGRFAEPWEIAAAALFLASDASNMVTGSNLVVDGGYTIH